jgi:hypothetical protein
MAITKSNKHKLSFDHDKPNEKGGCTLATPYGRLWKPQYLSGPGALEPVVTVPESKVYKPMPRVNPQGGIELSDPLWNVSASPSKKVYQSWQVAKVGTNLLSCNYHYGINGAHSL